MNEKITINGVVGVGIYERHGYYPVIYCVRHNAVRKEYTVSLEGLKQR